MHRNFSITTKSIGTVVLREGSLLGRHVGGIETEMDGDGVIDEAVVELELCVFGGTLSDNEEELFVVCFVDEGGYCGRDEQ